MFKLKEKNKLCRKYMQDIFGTLIIKGKLNKVILYLIKLKKEAWIKNRPFFLDVKSARPLKKRNVRSRYAKNLDVLKKLGFYHGGLRKKKIKQYINIAKVRKGIFVDNFFLLLELRLANIVYKMNFCNTIAEAIKMILQGNILVNKEVIKQSNYIVKEGQIVEVINIKRKGLYKKKQYITIQPYFLQINYQLLMCYIVSKPNITHIKYPFKIKKQFSYMLKTSKL